MGKLGNQSDRERGGLRFTVPELKRLLRVAQGVGLPVLGYEVDPATGKLLVRTGTLPDLPPTTALDEWRASRAVSH